MNASGRSPGQAPALATALNNQSGRLAGLGATLTANRQFFGRPPWVSRAASGTACGADGGPCACLSSCLIRPCTRPFSDGREGPLPRFQGFRITSGRG